MNIIKLSWLLLAVALLVFSNSALMGQRARFTDPYQLPVQSAPGSSGVVVGQVQSSGVPVSPPPLQQTAPPPATIVSPPFDPFVSESQPFPMPFGGAPGQPIQVMPPVVPYQSTNSFANNLNYTPRWPSTYWAYPINAWADLRATTNPKFFEQTRFRYTWVADSKTDGFGINKAAVSTTVSLGQQNHWRLSPGFNWNFWSGPDTATTGVDLPSQAYEFYLDTDFITNPCRNYGAEIDFSVGVYSDFKNMNSDSIRFMGVGLAWFRINEFNTFKIGVEYFDRVDIKMLPAFGLFFSPTPDVRFDLYFPRPRIAQRLRRVTTYEVWVYAGGEYGGDSWTVERMGGLNDRIDVNDVRAYVGGEWTGSAGFTGFFEFGYVFNRELVFESVGANNPIPVKDSIMLRAGFSF